MALLSSLVLNHVNGRLGSSKRVAGLPFALLEGKKGESGVQSLIYKAIREVFSPTLPLPSLSCLQGCQWHSPKQSQGSGIFT